LPAAHATLPAAHATLPAANSSTDCADATNSSTNAALPATNAALPATNGSADTTTDGIPTDSSTNTVAAAHWIASNNAADSVTCYCSTDGPADRAAHKLNSSDEASACWVSTADNSTYHAAHAVWIKTAVRAHHSTQESWRIASTDQGVSKST
jgi:hypothetical protein